MEHTYILPALVSRRARSAIGVYQQELQGLQNREGGPAKGVKVLSENW